MTSTAVDQRWVGALSLAQLISWGSVFYGFGVWLEPVERELGLGRAQTSLAFSLALLTEGLLAYPVARWIERGHERVVMTGGSLLLGLGLLLHSQVGSALAFYAVWAVLGVGMAATLYSPAFAVLTRRYPSDFRRAIIGLTFLGGLASTVFIPLIAWLIERYGWRAALGWLAVPQLLVCAPLHAWLLRAAPVAATAQRRPAEAAGSGFAELLRGAQFRRIGLFVLLMMMITSALPAHLVSLLREARMPESWAIAVPASIGAFQVLGRLLLYFFEHHFDLHHADRLIPALLPLGLAALLALLWGGGTQPLLAWLFVLLFGLGNGMLTIVRGTVIAQYVSQRHAVGLNGALGLPQALARAVAPLLLGALWSEQLGYRLGLALLCAAGGLALLALVQAQRRVRPDDAAERAP